MIICYVLFLVSDVVQSSIPAWKRVVMIPGSAVSKEPQTASTVSSKDARAVLLKKRIGTACDNMNVIPEKRPNNTKGSKVLTLQ